MDKILLFWSCTCKLLTCWKLKTKKVFIRLVPKNYYSFPSKNVFICLLFLKILRVSLHPGMTSMFEITSYAYIKLGRSQGGSIFRKFQGEIYCIFMWQFQKISQFQWVLGGPDLDTSPKREVCPPAPSQFNVC